MNAFKLAACSVSLLFALPLAAFELKVRSENPQIDEAAVRASVNAVAAEVGQRIPEDANIKVFVYTRALESKIVGQWIYFHRVQLTKAVSGGKPYPVRAWLPVKTVERYGIDEPGLIRQQLDASLRDFFTQLKAVDPDRGFE